MQLQQLNNIPKHSHFQKLFIYYEVYLMMVNWLSRIKTCLINRFSIKIDNDLSNNIQIFNSINYISVGMIGKIDWRKCKNMRGVLFKLMQQNKSIRISFSELKHLDTAVIAILLEVISYAKNKNIQLSFEAIKGYPLKVLKLNNVDKIFAKRSYNFNLLSHNGE